MGNVLIACEFSGTVRNEFAKLGHYALSCDLLPTEAEFINNNCAHYIGDIKEVLEDKRCVWDLMIAHPPCTYLTNAGVRHLYDSISSRNGIKAKISGQARWTEMYKACDFFNLLQYANIPRICIENPIPHKYARNKIGWYTQIINPWEHGHGETKKTCLWLKNLSKIIPTNIVSGRVPRIHNMSPSPDRGKKRSITYSGFAVAFAAQWGPLL